MGDEGGLGKRRDPLIAIPEAHRPLHGWSKEEVGSFHPGALGQ